MLIADAYWTMPKMPLILSIDKEKHDNNTQMCIRDRSYRTIIILVCGFSFIIANIGLTQLISITLPVLIMVYPVTMVLVVCSFFDRFFHGEPAVYICSMVCAFAVSVVDGLESGGLDVYKRQGLAKSVQQ